MKIEVYEETRKAPEKVLRLRLVQETDDQVNLVAVDERGEMVESGHLLSFLSDGTIYRHYYVNPDLSLSLNSLGQLKFYDEIIRSEEC